MQLFSAFNVRQETSFSLPLNTLLNTLEVFAPGDLGALTIRYPGPEAELMLEYVVKFILLFFASKNLYKFSNSFFLFINAVVSFSLADL